jgi:hypothetical protein
MSKMSRAEAGRIGGQKTKNVNQQRLRLALQSYNLDPALCQQCQKPIDFFVRKSNKFCSQSCSATHSNLKRTRSKKTVTKPTTLRYCKYCGQLKSCCSDICRRPQLVSSISKNFKCDLTKYIGSPEFITQYAIFRSKLTEEYAQSSLPTLAVKYEYSGDIRNFSKLFKHLGIVCNNIRDSLKNYHKRLGTYDNISEKETYYKACKFRIKDYSCIEGYHLLLKFGWYHPIKNKSGVSRDHRYSIYDGWANKIPPEIISHPANCQLMLHKDNVLKQKSSSITIEELYERVNGAG